MKKIRGKKITYSIQRKHLPNGRVVDIDVIEHPGAALIVPCFDDGKIIFLRQYRAVFGRYLFELPAGTLDREEKALNCAKRELIEETGYAAKRWVKLGKIYPVPGYSTEVIYIFKAEGLRRQEAEKDFDEVIEPIILTRQQIRKLFQKGQILDAKTICALALGGWLSPLNRR